MVAYFKKAWNLHPYRCVLGIALFVRMIAAIFAKGYGMHDDHFCVIEVVFNWMNGIDLPAPGDHSLRNFLYVGLHYLLFKGLESCAIYDPQIKMYIVRILHALYSLMLVWFGMKITEEYSDKKTATCTGIVLALFYLFPYMSVRNLQEMVCIPPMMLCVYLLIKQRTKKEMRDALIAGIAAGFAFVIRYQYATFIGMLGLLLLLDKKWKQAAGLTAGFIIVVIAIMGIPEYYVYGRPCYTFLEYLLYNSDSSNISVFPVNVWYTYIGTLLGFLIPPTSLLLVALFLMHWKKARYLVFPCLLFFVFHSAYPNKQERFILPIIPFVFIGAAWGWYWLMQENKIGQLWQNINRWLWRWFWVVNTLLLVITLFTYSKKTRVEIMSYFYDKPEVKAILFNNEDFSVPWMPFFYMGRTCTTYEVTQEKPLDSLKKTLKDTARPRPSYVVYLGDANLQERIRMLKEIFPSQEFVKKINPSLMDAMLYAVNPRHNINQVAFIYRIQGTE